ncbi:MAG: hypothetical protein KME10_29640 [Plectolyngbya sp. WJT66-NPBG17]|nr:hypothetical protein [Plectolyngbya sp. WJT66-NPBG17]MBW4529007.1 hypothetical protein [Phormidium tanganyikae FI6-MK23]
MKLLKIALVIAVFLVNLAIAQPSWADKPKASKNADYIEFTKAIETLTQEQETNGSTPELKQQIDELKLQKAVIASGMTWGQCRNETGSTLAISGAATGKSTAISDSLYFLADGQTTPDGWDCNGIYLPSGINAAGIDSTNPSIFSIMDGTRLIAKLNSDTGAIEFNVPPVKNAKADKTIPNISQAFIDSRIPSTLTVGEIDD